MEVGDKSASHGTSFENNTSVSKEIERYAEKLCITDNDVVLLRGEWEHSMVEQFATHISTLKVKAILVVLPTTKLDLSVIGIKEFYGLMKECEKRLKLSTDIEEEDDGVHSG